MNLLLDTHTFVWFVWADPKLSAAAKAMAGSGQRCPRFSGAFLKARRWKKRWQTSVKPRLAGSQSLPSADR